MLAVSEGLHAAYSRMFGGDSTFFGGQQGIYANLLAIAVIYHPERYDEILTKASSNLSFVDKVHFVKEFVED
jgi:ADP-dependent phosphofructokinase/glucokinase